jgi:hypothetical protein
MPVRRCLADLHLARTELIKSMRDLRKSADQPAICHTDKEA